MTGFKGHLVNFVERRSPYGRYEEDFGLKTIGYGDVVAGDTTIKGVTFLEGLEFDLISVSQLTDQGFTVCFTENSGIVYDSKGGTVLIAVRKNGAYFLKLNEESSSDEDED